MRLDISFEKIKENSKNWFTAQVHDKKKVSAFIICAVLLAIYFVLGVISKHIVAGLSDQLGAARWSDDIRMGQTSLFVTQDRKITEDDMKRFSYELEKKLIDSGIREDVQEDDGIKNLISVSYCAQGQATLVFENRKLENAAVIGSGGDFFIFHPLTLVSGTYFDGDDLMKDRIVIDEDMAWQLFGSTDIIGQCVLISGVPHYIVGVVKKPTGKLYEAAGLSKSYVYMSYDSLSKYGTILSGLTNSSEISEDGQTAQNGGINCVEVLCPNPVKGLSTKLAKESLAVSEESLVVIDNTDRFSAMSLFAVLRNFFTRSMWGQAIFYPYWENIARGYEDILALILLVRAIAILIVAFVLTIVVINLYRNKKWTLREIVKYLSEKKYDLEVSIKQKRNRSPAEDADNA